MIGAIKTIGVYVADQQKAVEFYTQKLGFEVRRTLPMGPQANWVEVAPAGAQTCLVLYPKSMMTNWAELKPSVVFHCLDVESTCKRLEAAGVRVVMPPTALPWGAFAKFADPDGNEFGLTSQQPAGPAKAAGIEIKHKITGEVVRVVESDRLAWADLSGAKLELVDLSRADLTGINLKGSDLSAADLSQARLAGANMAGATLAGTNLESASMPGAVLSAANMAAANMAGVDLSGSDLRGARLIGANLAGADLSRCDLRGADLSHGSLEDAVVVGVIFDETTRFPELFFDPEKKGAVRV
jgi:uncharacterized protein YjbI with pentapeptide repeats